MEKGLSDAILQSVTDCIITVDKAGSIISLNKALQDIAAIAPSEAVGLPLCDIFRYSKENDPFREMLEECLESAFTGQSIYRESSLITATGTRLPVQISSSPVLDTSGVASGVVTLLRDISREKEIDRMKTELIRSVSHEFRTPLSAIVGMTEMILEEDIDDTKKKEYLGTILSEGIRLSNMVSDLLNIARIESGKATFVSNRVDMHSLISGIKESFSVRLKVKNANLTYNINIGHDVMGDGEKIKQVITSLVDNSLTFSDDGCDIHIEVNKRRKELEIRVSDNGWGIPEDEVAHITERFYRGKHGQKVKGTGLGLSLCSDIITMHGGSMDIKSKLGKGTDIMLRLPYKEAERE
jgi:PAS domain S-box-containing protein